MQDVQENIEVVEEYNTEIVGKLTARTGGSVPMLVTDAETDGSITCTYEAGGVVHRFYGHQDEMIGFGDVLEYSGNCFTDAYDLPDLDEDEDEDEDEDAPEEESLPSAEDGENRPG